MNLNQHKQFLLESETLERNSLFHDCDSEMQLEVLDIIFKSSKDLYLIFSALALFDKPQNKIEAILYLNQELNGKEDS